MADLARVKAMKGVEAIFERYVGRSLIYVLVLSNVIISIKYPAPFQIPSAFTDKVVQLDIPSGSLHLSPHKRDSFIRILHPSFPFLYNTITTPSPLNHQLTPPSFHLLVKSRNYNGFDQDFMSSTKLISASPEGTADFEFHVSERYGNMNGVMHGGAAALIFDMCTTSALGPVARPGHWECVSPSPSPSSLHLTFRYSLRSILREELSKPELN
jgi:hypothetical protein